MTANNTKNQGFTVIDGVVYPTQNAAFRAATQAEIDAENALVDAESEQDSSEVGM